MINLESLPFFDRIDAVRTNLIVKALEDNDYYISRTAKSLGMKRTTLSIMMKRLGISVDRDSIVGVVVRVLEPLITDPDAPVVTDTCRINNT